MARFARLRGDAKALLVDRTEDGDTQIVSHAVTGAGSGRKVVTTAGTRVQLVTASTPVKQVIISGLSENTGIVVVGGSAVVAAVATRQGYPLRAWDAVAFDIDDLIDLYIDSTVSGEGVSWMSLT